MSAIFTDRHTAEATINQKAERGEDFVFLISYRMDQCLVCHPDEAAASDLYYNFRGIHNAGQLKGNFREEEMIVRPIPPSPDSYQIAFDEVMKQIRAGYTYLINLCVESPLEYCPSLPSIFLQASAPYKLLLQGHFVVFSPEPFVRIDQSGGIKTHPMKGTIRADLPNADKKLLDDPKEQAEHFTIVDLLRNDLSISAKEVSVDRFRYLSKIQSGNRALWQTSSEISGQLPKDFRRNLGTILFKMLPAGSITGAPKKKTVEILSKVEQFDRGFYTGIAGIFQNGVLDSAVLIRFIEKRGADYFYKSGGGITFQSDSKKEYEELIEKIYVPTA
ncbi:MAG: aminodeoxychorismate synthase component I [Saprospirales bacterium]|nr:MAG: aminodeoxychorismate synthase component I [Saprospirales bacterium]